MHMSALISNKVIFNRSPAALRFCARISLRRITADNLTLTKGNVTLWHIWFHPTVERGQMLLIRAAKIVSSLLITVLCCSSGRRVDFTDIKI